MLSTFTARADAADADKLERLLAGAVRRHGANPADIGDFELDVRVRGDDRLVSTYVSTT